MVYEKVIFLVFILLRWFQTIGGKRDYLEFTAGAGATVEFECKNTQISFDKVTWWRNDSSEFVAEKGENFQNFSGNYTNRLIFQGKNLIISDCRGLDHGFYFCETTYKGEKRRGGYYKFIVEEKPKCDRIVTDINVLNGTSAFLPCYVRGKPTPTYLWRKVVGKNLVELNERFTPSAIGLTIRLVNKSVAGTYIVTLRNKLGIYNQRLLVHVKTRDTIKAKNYHNIVLGSDVILNCEKYTIQKKTTIEWLDSSGSDVSSLDRFTVLSNGSLEIQSVQLNDDGLYTCKKRTRTDKGIWLKSVLIYLNVQFAPVIIVIKSNVKVYKNSHILIVCTAKGNPAPRSRWYLPDGTVLKSSKKHEVLSNGSLIVRNVQLTDVMNYTCSPHNSVGSASRSSTHLSVIVPPYFIGEHVEIVRARVGGRVRINCAADGLPKPSVSWSYVNESAVNQREKFANTGELTIENIGRNDEGVYACLATSSAGKSSRQVRLIVLDKPQSPTEFFVITQNGSMYFSWKPSYNGGATQTFEVWYLATYKSEYEWSSVGVISNNYKIHLDDTDTAGERDVSFYCSLRSQNSEGYSDFTRVVKTAKLLPHGGKLRSTKLESGLSDLPLPPYAFTVVISTADYTLDWKYILTPGRPASSKFLIEYRERNSTSWKTFVRKERARRGLNAAKGQQNIVNIKHEDIPGLRHPLQFQVSTLTSTNVKSKPSVPVINDVRKVVVAEASMSASKINLIPPIVMAIIFGLFTVILVVGLYCYCDRKKKRGNLEESKINLVANDNNNRNSLRNSLHIPENTKGLPLDYTRYHLRSCPALKLGESNQTPDRNKPDDVFVLLKPNAKENIICTCNKNHMSVNTLGHAKKENNNKRSSLYKSTSLPSVFFTSDADISSDVLSVDQSEILDESDFAKKPCGSGKDGQDAVALLQRGGMFRDSFDKFCRSDSTLRRKNAKGDANKGTLNKLPEADIASSETPIIDQTEQALLASKMSDDENTETKSIKSNKSIDRKSSGFGDGESSTSDPDSLRLDTLGTPTPPHKAENLRLLNTLPKKDTGYFSDVPTRVSPLLPPTQNIHPGQKHKLPKTCNHNGYFSEDETSTRIPYRPLAPPPYNQAIMDIERMSESTGTDITDSENMCKQLLEMERQMGVQLDDSIDDNLDKHHMLDPPVRFQNSSYRDTGYMSDIGGSSLKTKYSNREKNIRCAQLLNEFKNNKQQLNLHDEDNIEEADLTSTGFDPKHTLRSISLMESIISEELPSLKRSNSTNSNTCNEWLV